MCFLRSREVRKAGITPRYKWGRAQSRFPEANPQSRLAVGPKTRVRGVHMKKIARELMCGPTLPTLRVAQWPVFGEIYDNIITSPVTGRQPEHKTALSPAVCFG